MAREPKPNTCTQCGRPWDGDDALCTRCFAELHPEICAECGAVFSESTRRADGDPHVCEECHREKIEQEKSVTPAAEADWPDPAKVPEMPRVIEDTEELLLAAVGEGPGVETFPEPTSRKEAERQARAKLYAADLAAGKPIAFIAWHKQLSTWQEKRPGGAGPGFGSSGTSHVQRRPVGTICGPMPVLPGSIGRAAAANPAGPTGRTVGRSAVLGGPGGSVLGRITVKSGIRPSEAL